MAKSDKPETQKPDNVSPKSTRRGEQTKTTTSQPAATPVTPVTPAADANKGKQSSKKRGLPVGGTAITGAKSTQPKELTNGSPSNQQPEYYNRETRRRMQHMGTGPYSERATVDPRERRKKRQERIKERQERIKHTVDTRGPSRNVKLGSRNTYFLITVIAIIVILIILFLIIRHPF